MAYYEPFFDEWNTAERPTTKKKNLVTFLMTQLKRGLKINSSTSGSEVSNPYEMLFQSSLRDTVRIHKSSVGHPEIFFGSGSDFSDGFGSYMNLVSLTFLSYILPYRLKHCKCVRLHITTRYTVFRGIFYKRNLLHGSGS